VQKLQILLQSSAAVAALQKARLVTGPETKEFQEEVAKALGLTTNEELQSIRSKLWPNGWVRELSNMLFQHGEFSLRYDPTTENYNTGECPNWSARFYLPLEYFIS
jgi:hypothetical protein